MEDKIEDIEVKEQNLGGGYQLLVYGLVLTLLIGGGKLMKNIHFRNISKLEKGVVEQTLPRDLTQNNFNYQSPVWFYKNNQNRENINYLSQ